MKKKIALIALMVVVPALMGAKGCKSDGGGGSAGGGDTTSFDITATPGIIAPTGNYDFVSGYVQMHTNYVPRAFEGWFYLQFRYHGSWLTEDEKVISLGNLAPQGSNAAVTLRAEAARGQWRIRYSINIVSHTGIPQVASGYFPGPDGQGIGGPR